MGLVCLLEIGWFLASVRKALANTIRTVNATGSSYSFLDARHDSCVCHLQTQKAHLSLEGQVLGLLCTNILHLQRQEYPKEYSSLHLLWQSKGSHPSFRRDLGLAFKSAPGLNSHF